MKLFYSCFMEAGGLMKLIAAFGFIFLMSLLASAAPVNDNFASAQLLSGISGTYVGTNVGATKEPNEPNHALNRGGSSVWYKFVAPGNGVLRFSTNNSNIDTLVSVYVGSSVNNLRLVGENDDYTGWGFSHAYSLVYIGTQAGQTYYIAVDGKNPLDGSGAPAGTVAGNFSFANTALNDDFANATPLATGSGTYSKTISNVGASKESGEPDHMDNAGGKSIWFNYYNDVNYPRSITLTLNSSRASDANQHVNALFSIYTGNTLATLTPVLESGFTSVGKIRLTFLAAPNSTYHIAIDGYDNGFGASSGTFTLTYGITKDARTADFDEDGKVDLTVFRPTGGNWYSRDSGTNNIRALHWGLNGDKPLMSKNEHGESLYTVFRPDTGVWYHSPINSFFQAYKWGMSGDIALMKNTWQPTGIIGSTSTVFRPSTGIWWFHNSQGGSGFQFGQAGDVPVLADFDGDGSDEITVFRPSDGMWYIFNQATNQTQYVQWGLNGDIPTPADFDGDGISDIAIFRPSTGDWWFKNTQTAIQFGAAGDKPQPADYDGDGKADLAVFRNGNWWILQSSNGTVKFAQWGLSTDIPISAPVY